MRKSNPRDVSRDIIPILFINCSEIITGVNKFIKTDKLIYVTVSRKVIMTLNKHHIKPNSFHMLHT